MNRFLAAFNIRENCREIFYRPSERMTLVDGVRAFSILYVIVYHALIAIMMGNKPQFLEFIQNTPWYFQWVLLGDRGVDSFFVISGFLIGQILFKEHLRSGTIDLKRFFIRRWLRLTPLYYLVLLLVFLAFTPLFGPNADKNYLWAFVFYVNNFLSMKHQYFHIAWSLAIEEQFYIVFGIFLAFGFYKIKNKLNFLFGLLILSFLIQAILLLLNPDLLVTGDVLLAGVPAIGEKYWEVIYDNLYTRYGALLSGVILAYVYVHHWKVVEQFMNEKRSNFIFLLSLFFIIFFSILPVFSGQEFPKIIVFLYHVTYRNIFSICVALLILVAMFPYGWAGKFSKFLSSKLFFPISQLSYSMYLMHLPVLMITAGVLRAFGIAKGLSYANLFIVLGFSIVPMFLVCAFLYVFIEKPFMNMRK